VQGIYEAEQLDEPMEQDHMNGAVMMQEQQHQQHQQQHQQQEQHEQEHPAQEGPGGELGNALSQLAAIDPKVALQMASINGIHQGNIMFIPSLFGQNGGFGHQENGMKAEQDHVIAIPTGTNLLSGANAASMTSNRFVTNGSAKPKSRRGSVASSGGGRSRASSLSVTVDSPGGMQEQAEGVIVASSGGPVLPAIPPSTKRTKRREAYDEEDGDVNYEDASEEDVIGLGGEDDATGAIYDAIMGDDSFGDSNDEENRDPEVGGDIDLGLELIQTPLDPNQARGNLQQPDLKNLNRRIVVVKGPAKHQVKEFNVLPNNVLSVNYEPKNSDYILIRLLCDKKMRRREKIIFMSAVSAKHSSSEPGGNIILNNLKISKDMLQGRTKGFKFCLAYTLVVDGKEVETIKSNTFYIWSNVNQPGFPRKQRETYLAQRIQANQSKRKT
jgi:hypothetical protein